MPDGTTSLVRTRLGVRIPLPALDAGIAQLAERVKCFVKHLSPFIAAVAQLVEHVLGKDAVTSSSLVGSSNWGRLLMDRLGPFQGLGGSSILPAPARRQSDVEAQVEMGKT